MTKSSRYAKAEKSASNLPKNSLFGRSLKRLFGNLTGHTAVGFLSIFVNIRKLFQWTSWRQLNMSELCGFTLKRIRLFSEICV